MSADDLGARVKRLDVLGRGLMKETVVIKEAEDPLLYRERLEYLKSLRAALGGIEAARVTLVRALQRLGGLPSE
jgi:hypothetical protein